MRLPEVPGTLLETIVHLKNVTRMDKNEMLTYPSWLFILIRAQGLGFAVENSWVPRSAEAVEPPSQPTSLKSYATSNWLPNCGASEGWPTTEVSPSGTGFGDNESAFWWFKRPNKCVQK